MLGMDSTRRHPVRLTSLLALFTLVSGWIGAPAVDAIRFHRDGHGSEGRVHFDSQGGCREHAEDCVLSLTVGPTTTGFASEAPSPSALEEDPENPRGVLVVLTSRHSPSNPRAPPTFLA